VTVAVVLIFLTCITTGVGLTFHTGLSMRAEERFFAGWVLGVVAFTISGIVSTRLFSFGGPAVAVAVVLALGASVPGWRRGQQQAYEELVDLRRRVVQPLLSGDNPMLLAALLIPVWVLIARMFHFAYQTDPDGGLMVGHLASFSDWQAHLTYTASFAYADNTALNLPLAADNNIGYHAGINYFAALLIPAGSTLPGALQLSGAFALFAFPGVMYCAGMRVFDKQAVALLGTVLFLFFGGWGFIDFFDDLRVTVGPELANVTVEGSDLVDSVVVAEAFTEWRIGETLTNLPQTYTRLPDPGQGWWSSNPIVMENPIVGHFFPQRPTIIGFPLVLLVLSWLYTAWSDIADRGAERWRTMMFCGVVVGLTPFFNLFAFGVPLAFVGMWWIFTRFRREWLYFLVPATVLALPVVIFLQPPSSSLEWPYHWVERIRSPGDAYASYSELAGDRAGGERFSFLFSYLADQLGNMIVFWFRNMGFFLPLLVLAQAARGVLTKRVALGLLPIWLFFIVPNAIKPHPWNGNNTHYFIFVLLLGAMPIAALLVSAVRKAPVSLFAIVPLVLTLTMAGFIDVLATNDRAQGPWPQTAMDSAGIAVGEWARTTDTDAVFVVELGWGPGAASPHQHPLSALSGRTLLVGNGGWVFDLGIEDWAVRTDHSRVILEAGVTADGRTYEDLISLYDVDYLVVGPTTRTPQWDPNTAFWEEAADVVYRHAGWTVYEV